MRHVVIRHHVHENFHNCRLPGRYRRYQEKLGKGSVVECKRCHKQWILTASLDGLGWVRHR